MTIRHAPASESNRRRSTLFAFVMLFTGGGAVALGVGGPSPWQAAAGDTALASQKCVLCGRAFAEKLAQLCSSCDRGKCFLVFGRNARQRLFRGRSR